MVPPIVGFALMAAASLVEEGSGMACAGRSAARPGRRHQQPLRDGKLAQRTDEPSRSRHRTATRQRTEPAEVIDVGGDEWQHHPQPMGDEVKTVSSHVQSQGDGHQGAEAAVKRSAGL